MWNDDPLAVDAMEEGRGEWDGRTAAVAISAELARTASAAVTPSVSGDPTSAAADPKALLVWMFSFPAWVVVLTDEYALKTPYSSPLL